MVLFRKGAQPPLSNHQIQRQILTCRAEQLRARHMQHSGREAWFTALMDNALDVLAERYRVRGGPG